MKKWLALLLCGLLVFANGCSIYNTNPKEGSSQESSGQFMTEDGLQVDFQETYYKLQAETVEIDMDALTKYCLGDHAQYMNQAEEEVVFPEDEDGRYALLVEDNDYCWIYTYEPADYTFLQVDEPYIGQPNEKKALKTAKEIVSMVDVEFSEEVEITSIEWHITEKEDDYATEFSFTPQYKGVDFVGNTPMRSAEGEEFKGGTYADVVIDADSIQGVGMYNMFCVVEELETYSISDFIDVNDAVRAAESECSKMIGTYLMENPDLEVSGGAKEASVIYVPASAEAYLEWIPAYEIIVEYTIGESVERLRAIVDAFDGHVYDWRGVGSE